MEPHEAAEVDAHAQALRALNEDAGPAARLCPDDDVAPGEKLVYLIRHGEGAHNVAQRAWRAAGKPSEPYTLANDPQLTYVDAELTETGRAQAAALAPRLAALQRPPELLVVSPMRRATATGLAAVANVTPAPSILAHESLHETGGRHTCDKRLDVAQLRSLYPAVDYSLLESEADPLWDEETREAPGDVARRAAAFAAWLRSRPERVVAVAAHSGFLLALCNAVLSTADDGVRAWFGTGECRAVGLSWDPPPPAPTYEPRHPMAARDAAAAPGLDRDATFYPPGAAVEYREDGSRPWRRGVVEASNEPETQDGPVSYDITLDDGGEVVGATGAAIRPAQPAAPPSPVFQRDYVCMDPARLAEARSEGAIGSAVVVKLLIGGQPPPPPAFATVPLLPGASPPLKRKQPPSLRGVTNEEEMKQRMFEDGWITEEKTRTGTNHVDRYYLPPPGSMVRKKLRSIVEVARQAYPEYLKEPGQAKEPRSGAAPVLVGRAATRSIPVGDQALAGSLAAYLAPLLLAQAAPGTRSAAIRQQAAAMAAKYAVAETKGKASYVDEFGGGVYNSRAAVARGLGLLATGRGTANAGDAIEVWWDGGCGGWYSAVVVEAAQGDAPALVKYEDGLEERLPLTAKPWADAAVPPHGEPFARWRPAGAQGHEDAGVLLEFDPIMIA